MSTNDKLRALAEDWLSEIDWSDGRSNYGDNEAYEKCARQLTAILDAEQQDETTAQSEESEHTCCACYTHNCLPCCNPGHPLAPAPVPDDDPPHHLLTEDVPDDEAVEALAREVCPCKSIDHDPHESQECAWTLGLCGAIRDLGYVSPEAHARAERDAVRAVAERIAEAIEALPCPGSPPDPLAKYAFETGKAHAANIAREAVE